MPNAERCRRCDQPLGICVWEGLCGRCAEPYLTDSCPDALRQLLARTIREALERAGRRHLRKVSS